MTYNFRDKSKIKSTQDDNYVYPIDFNEYIDTSEKYSDIDYISSTVEEKAKAYQLRYKSYKIYKYGDVNAVQINMTGNRASDNRAYKNNGGFIFNVPYELHHNPDMDANNNCTMIALPKSFHDSIKPHWGAVCQYHAKYGSGY